MGDLFGGKREFGGTKDPGPPWVFVSHSLGVALALWGTGAEPAFRQDWRMAAKGPREVRSPLLLP